MQHVVSSDVHDCSADVHEGPSLDVDNEKSVKLVDERLMIEEEKEEEEKVQNEEEENEEEEKEEEDKEDKEEEGKWSKLFGVCGETWVCLSYVLGVIIDVLSGF